jgi:type I restriction enzyme S subunit
LGNKPTGKYFRIGLWKALKKTERTNGDYPVYGSGGVDGTHNEYLVKGPELLLRKGTVGSLHWEYKDFYPIDTVFFVRPKEYFSLVYCYQLLKTLGLENMNTDAAVPGLNRNNAYRLDVITPTQPIIARFTNIIQAIRYKMDSNHNEAENLTALRDTLLPKRSPASSRWRIYQIRPNRTRITHFAPVKLGAFW